MTPLAEKPPIHLTDGDYDIIADLALSVERRSPALSKMLLDEINRAEIHDRGALPTDVVAIGSEVEFLHEAGVKRLVQLVLPGAADIEAGRVSILTPVGAGLIGLREGQSIDWPRRTDVRACFESSRCGRPFLETAPITDASPEHQQI